MARQKQAFSAEFRDEAVKMVIETSRPVAAVAHELGLVEGTLVAISLTPKGIGNRAMPQSRMPVPGSIGENTRLTYRRRPPLRKKARAACAR